MKLQTSEKNDIAFLVFINFLYFWNDFTMPLPKEIKSGRNKGHGDDKTKVSGQEPTKKREPGSKVSNLWWFNLEFFNIVLVWKRYTSSRNCTSKFEFWSFSGLLISITIVTLSWCWAATLSRSSQSGMRPPGRTTDPPHCGVYSVAGLPVVFWILCSEHL